MSFRESLQRTFRRLSGAGALENAGRRIGELGRRLDDLNCSLAERALPEDRKSRVSELSLNRKARLAGQKVPKKIPEKI